MKEIIPQIKLKFKEARKLINDFFLLVFFLVFAGIAFFAGRFFKFLENRPAFYFENLEIEQKYFEDVYQEEKSEFLNNFGGANVKNNNYIVASKGGKKYYYVWCKGAENIKESNKRFFQNEELAENAGYTKAASCK